MAGRKQKKLEVVEESTQEVEDRSAYNCTECGGEGLLNDSTLCMQCAGTGKV